MKSNYRLLLLRQELDSGSPDLPDLDVGHGDTVDAEITIKLHDVFNDGRDLVIFDQRELTVKETDDVFVIKK